LANPSAEYRFVRFGSDSLLALFAINPQRFGEAAGG
jgi:hypothetical protein